MEEGDWNFPDGRFLSYVLAPEDGRDPLFIVLNGADETVEIKFPQWPGVLRWLCLFNTANGEVPSSSNAPGAAWTVEPRSVLAFTGRP
jgi:glycogen operon protein